MTNLLKKKNTAKFQVVDPTIESLQERLLKSLSTAFDPTAVSKSDDIFLAQDYSLSNFQDTSSSDPFKVNNNPYQNITERARSYVEKAQVERPLRQKNTTSTLNKQSNTFLTHVEMEGNTRKNKVEQTYDYDFLDYKPPVPEITYDGILGDFSVTTKKLDDLEELRRMIKKTKKDMNEYGKELLNLKSVIVGINDYAVKELGYGASSDLLHNMENTITSLKDKKELKGLKKNGQELKGSRIKNNDQDENTYRGSKNSVFSGTGSFIVGKRNFGSNLRAASIGASKKY